MNEKQRMSEVLQDEQAYRQHGVAGLVRAHDNVDYLFTRVNLLADKNKALVDLLGTAYRLLCNSQPHGILDAGYQAQWRRVMHEITEIKENEKISAEHKYKQKILSKIAHEFKTPMIALIGVTNKMLLRESTDSKNSNCAVIILAT